MRDWLTAFRPASFRGVRFFVQSEDLSGGRRVAVSPIAYSDRSVMEDMGRDPLQFSVTAYLASDRADSEARQMTAALAAKGAGTLVLPMHGACRARVVNFSRSRDKDRAGYIALSIEFLEDGLAAAPFARVPGVVLVADLMTQGAALLGAALAAQQGTSNWARERTLIGAQAANARLAAVTGGGSDEASHDAIEQADAKLGRFADDPAGFGAALTLGWRAHALATDSDDGWRRLQTALAEPDSSAAGRVEQVALGLALCLVTVRRSLASQQDAAAARAALALAVEPVFAAASSLGTDIFALMQSVSGEAALDLSASAANLAPLVRVETGGSISAVRLAYDLYGDPARGRELCLRNKASMPALMPVRFEAVSA